MTVGENIPAIEGFGENGRLAGWSAAEARTASFLPRTMCYPWSRTRFPSSTPARDIARAAGVAESAGAFAPRERRLRSVASSLRHRGEPAWSGLVLQGDAVSAVRALRPPELVRRPDVRAPRAAARLARPLASARHGAVHRLHVAARAGRASLLVIGSLGLTSADEKTEPIDNNAKPVRLVFLALPGPGRRRRRRRPEDEAAAAQGAAQGAAQDQQSDSGAAAAAADSSRPEARSSRRRRRSKPRRFPPVMAPVAPIAADKKNQEGLLKEVPKETPPSQGSGTGGGTGSGPGHRHRRRQRLGHRPRRRRRHRRRPVSPGQRRRARRGFLKEVRADYTDEARRAEHQRRSRARNRRAARRHRRRRADSAAPRIRPRRARRAGGAAVALFAGAAQGHAGRCHRRGRGRIQAEIAMELICFWRITAVSLIARARHERCRVARCRAERARSARGSRRSRRGRRRRPSRASTRSPLHEGRRPAAERGRPSTRARQSPRAAGPTRPRVRRSRTPRPRRGPASVVRPAASSRAAEICRCRAVADAATAFSAAPSAPASGGRQRGLAIAAVLLFVVVAGGRLLDGLRQPRADRQRRRVGAQPRQSPLELVSLRHERHGATLAVTGLVRNPVGGTRRRAADRRRVPVRSAGRLHLSSARADVDFVTLVAGRRVAVCHRRWRPRPTSRAIA